MSTPVNRYSKVAMLIHWLTAILILGLLPLGIYMADLPLSPQKLQLYSYHKWAGITVLLLAILRVLWRIGHPPPALPANQPRWQQAAAHAVHHILYALIFIAPLSGWLMSSAKGFTTVWFGVLPLPNLVSKDKELASLLSFSHTFINYALLAIVVLHIAAALKHQLIDRDRTINRMLP